MGSPMENTISKGPEAAGIENTTFHNAMTFPETKNQDVEEKSVSQDEGMNESACENTASIGDSQCLTPPGSSSGRNTPTRQSTSKEAQNSNNWTEFRDCKMSFAIDTSGSTLGEVLKREQQAISDISRLLSGPSKDAVRILPWNSAADGVINLYGLGTLASYGGTNPMVLLKDSASLVALQNSSLWFLLTDGEIGDYSLRRFANNFAHYELHGTACVIMVFGPKLGKPSQCNISVGVSVFAIVPDCLFLFQDTLSGDVYLLQCKGRFTEILERTRQEQPELDNRVSWEDLPQISLDDLSCISIPAPKKLGKNEVALENNLVINLDDLLSGRLHDGHIIDTILRSQENIRTISLTAQTRGQVDQLRNWVIKQELDPVDFSSLERHDIGGQARGSISAIMQQIQTKAPSQGEEFHRVQAELRAAHSRNSEALIEAKQNSSFTARERSISISTVVARSSTSVSKGRSISLTGFAESLPVPYDPMEAYGAKSSQDWLFTKGFRKPTSDAGQFKGICPICATEDTTLALLLREPPTSLVTPGFPEANSHSKLAFPLAMGNFPETDIISSLICCDACSYIVAEGGETRDTDNVVGALPLVSYSANKQAYNFLLHEALLKRFDEEDVPLAFIAILYTAAHRIRSQGLSNDQLLLNAIEWACADLAGSVQCQNTLSSSFAAEDGFMTVEPLNEVLVQTSDDALHSVSRYYLQYPIEGFVVMTMILDSSINQKRPQIHLTAKKIVFQRLLFHITEEFHKHMAEQGPVITHIMMSQLLIQESARRERSPWNMDRKKSSFRNLQGLTRSLFGDRKTLTPKLSIGLDILTATPLLTADNLSMFKKLGLLFDWVEVKSGHALAVFLHFLYRYKLESKSATDHFMQLASNVSLAKIFLDPSDISARTAEALLGSLPHLIQPETEGAQGT